MKTAILATGQGSQYVGMLKDIFLQYPIAKKRLEDTNEILGFEITKILFDGPAEKLQETRYTQPALFLHTAILTDLIKDKIEFNAAAGHSVGEYAALYAAEVLDFETALKLVALRGQLMFNAGEYEPGTMFALIGGDEEKIENLCKELSNNANSDGNVIVPANYNSPGQIVISGSADYLRQNADKFKSIGAKIVKELNVSGAFHSPLMLPAKAELEKAILNEKFNDAIIRLKGNMSMDYIKSKGYRGTDLAEKNGETYDIDYAPFMNNRNEIGGVILVFKNITEQHRIDKLQKEFVANVSHELKTPITTIKSYAETLLDGALEEKDVAEEFLNVINSESDRMSRLVSDLLRLSRMDYEQTKWHKEKINLRDMVNLIIKKLQIQIKNKNINMHMNVPEELNIMFDKDGFEQIVLNIAGNAVKYSTDKGNVWIDAKRNNNKVVISIKDDGQGIPKQDQARIFERFYRVDKARARGFGGTGLGLSIAKQIAEAHNCTIAVNSEIDKGTEMIITIPE